MFENVLKGAKKAKGTKKWGVFGNKDANRWKKEGSVKNMSTYRKPKGL